MRNCLHGSCKSHLITLMMVCSLSLVLSTEVRAQTDNPSLITLNLDNNLASLVDLCAERLNLNIEYDAKALRSVTVTLRLGAGVTDEELWTLTNRLMAVHGFTSIHMPGEDVLSIVKLQDAQKKAHFDDSVNTNVYAGYASVVRQMEWLSVENAIKTIKPLLSQPAGSAIQLGDTDLVLISDLKPRLDEILKRLEEWDKPDSDSELTIARFPVKHMSAAKLVAEVSAAVTARDSIAARPLKGKLSAALGDDAVILIAPLDTVDQWRSLIKQFDNREPVIRRSYSPGVFSINEVADLIEQTAKLSRGGSGDEWKLVTDELTNSLIITATNSEHEQIEQLLDRLNKAPDDTRMTMRSFVIRNREASELISVIEPLLEMNIQESSNDENSGKEAEIDNVDNQDQSSTENTTQQSNNTSISSSFDNSVSLSISVDTTTNTLIAIGTPRALDHLGNLIQTLDIRQPQVELEMFVVSLNEGDTLDLGVEIQKLEISGQSLLGLSSLFGLSDIALESTSPLIGGRGFSGVVLSPGDFSIVVRALRTLSSGVSRSYPRVLVNNNEQATLSSVIQEPYTSTNAANTIATTSFGGSENAGTEITVTPHIAEGDHIVLEYSISLSSFVGESSDAALPPPRQETSLQSVVTIPDGYTIAVGGLEVTSEAEAVSQIPLLSDIPIIGELFKNRSLSDSRSRFYVFIRANVLRHDGFEDLKYMSDLATYAADIDDGWPTLEPRIIK